MSTYNWQIFGHQKVVKILQKSLDNNKLAHAYLFSGKEHLGKHLLAQELIKTIYCLDWQQQNQKLAEKSPCDKCVFCQQLEKRIHPDFYFLKKEEGKKNISVEQVREMQKVLNLGSFLNSYKIALVSLADDLSESAQNALLKVLEEPRKKTILILIANQPELILPTIRSRCQQIKLHSLAKEEVFQALAQLGANREKADILASYSQGQIGLAINFYNNPELFAAEAEKIRKFLLLFNSNLSQRFALIDELLKNYKTNSELNDFLKQELNSWQLVVRDILALKNSLENLVVNLEQKPVLASLAQKYSVNKLLMIINNINIIKKYLPYNINPRLAVENLVLSF